MKTTKFEMPGSDLKKMFPEEKQFHIGVEIPYWKNFLYEGDMTQEDLEDMECCDRFELIEDDFNSLVESHLPSPKINTEMMDIRDWGSSAKGFLKKFEKAIDLIDQVIALNNLDDELVYQHVEEFCVPRIEQNERY